MNLLKYTLFLILPLLSVACSSDDNSSNIVSTYDRISVENLSTYRLNGNNFVVTGLIVNDNNYEVNIDLKVDVISDSENPVIHSGVIKNLKLNKNQKYKLNKDIVFDQVMYSNRNYTIHNYKVIIN
ncbi:hypothetical protein [Empedobacter brevis]|uniref:hypothetical protein n=1 Tax=Empedobacter brevis TaxID=247 RepID=UPI00289FBE61|nr:hypothetical protein [Empedobacter brevis]